MPTREHSGVSWRRVAFALIIICIIADIFPRHGAPDFRYTGSDPAVDVWNLGWPLVLSIFDPRSGIHVGPFFYVVIPFQIAVISLVGLVFAFWTRHNKTLNITAASSGS